METTQRLGELEDMCKELNLTLGEPTGRGGKVYQRKDYIRVLCKYHLIKEYGSIEQIPKNLRFRFAFESPQLAEQYSSIKKQEELDLIWESDNTWLTEKINGIRGTLVYNQKDGYNCFSRELNPKTFIYFDYIDRMFDKSITGYQKPFAVDIEIVLGNFTVMEFFKERNIEVKSEYEALSALFMLDMELFRQVRDRYKDLFTYKLIDVYHWDNRDRRKDSYKEREGLFELVCTELRKNGIRIYTPRICKDVKLKKAFHEGIMKEGGEGTIAVFLDKPCLLDGRRKRDYWVKIKRSVFNFDDDDADKLEDTIDGFISHIEYSNDYPELVQKIWVSAITDLGKNIVIADIEDIPLSVRCGGVLQIGTVVELSGSKISDNKIVGALIERVRVDKSKEDCTVNFV